MDWELISYSKTSLIIATLAASIGSGGCASSRSFLGISEGSHSAPISNPFLDYQATAKNLFQKPMILRTKKGDKTVELELPSDADHLNEITLPMVPSSSEGRGIASVGNPTFEPELPARGDTLVSPKLKDHRPTYSDREIIQSFPQPLPHGEERRNEIEHGLNLSLSTSDDSDSGTSYLARLDVIKQLYKQGRYEAALIETDELGKQYPTDPKLHEMRGTLLDHMGRRELALRSWSQALRFDPNNQALRKFIGQKQFVASPKPELPASPPPPLPTAEPGGSP